MPRVFFAFAWLVAGWLVPGARGEASVRDGFEGAWLGRVVAPNASTEIGLVFTRAPQGLTVAFSMPAMSVYGADLGPARFEGDAFVLPALDTTLTLHEDRLVGTFAIPHLPVELHRVPALPVPSPGDAYPTGPAPVWNVALGGHVWASPVVRDDVVYLGTTDGTFQARSAQDGGKRWAWQGPNPIYGPALVTDAHAYFVDSAFDLVCLDRSSGRLAWRRALHEGGVGRVWRDNETFNHRTPQPILWRDTLYVGSPDGGIYAIDPQTGDVRWRHEANTAIYATAGVAGNALLFGGFDGSVFVFDPEHRTATARTQLPRAVVSTPVVANGIVVAGCRDYMLYGRRAGDLSPAWRRSYWFSWVESTPAVVDGTMYIGGSDYARVMAFDPASGSVLWETQVRGLTWGTPLVTDGLVFAGTHAQAGALIAHEGGIVALDRASGTVRWRIALPLGGDADRAGIIGSLALAGKRVIAAAYDGTLSAYPAEAP